MKSLVLLALCCAEIFAQDSKIPVPDTKAQANAEKTIRDVFKEEYSAKSIDAQKKLALKLAQQGIETKDDPSFRYVLLREAAELAGRSGDLETLLRSVDEICASYQVNAPAFKESILCKMESVFTRTEDLKALIEALLKLVQEALDSDQVDVAMRSAQTSLGAARRIKDMSFVLSADAAVRSVSEYKSFSDTAKKAEEAVKNNPGDPVSNTVLGEYLCFVKGNWESGLRYLVQGSDKALKSLAEREQAHPESAQDRIAIADLWREMAEKEKSGLRKVQLIDHSRKLYESALPGASGLLRVKIEKFLDAEAAARNTDSKALGAVKGINLLSLLDLREDTVSGTWKLESRVLVSPPDRLARMQIPYLPPEEYDLTVEVERVSEKEGSLHIGLLGAGRQFILTCDGWAGDIVGLELLDGKSANVNETTLRHKICEIGRVARVVCSVRKDGVTIVADGAKVIHWRGNLGRLSIWEGYGINRNYTLPLCTNGGIFRFHRISLVEITGNGKRLR